MGNTRGEIGTLIVCIDTALIDTALRNYCGAVVSSQALAKERHHDPLQ